MLAIVLGMLAVISVIAVALVGMTIAALRISSSFSESLDRTSAADSALDTVVHYLQDEALAAGEDCYGASNLGGAHPIAYQRLITFPDGESMTVIIDCATTTPINDSRDITLTAFVDGQASAFGPGAHRDHRRDRWRAPARPGAAYLRLAARWERPAHGSRLLTQVRLLLVGTRT